MKLKVFFSEKLTVDLIVKNQDFDLQTLVYDRSWVLGNVSINMNKVCFIQCIKEAKKKDG